MSNEDYMIAKLQASTAANMCVATASSLNYVVNLLDHKCLIDQANTECTRIEKDIEAHEHASATCHQNRITLLRTQLIKSEAQKQRLIDAYKQITPLAVDKESLVQTLRSLADIVEELPDWKGEC